MADCDADELKEIEGKVDWKKFYQDISAPPTLKELNDLIKTNKK